MALKKMHMEEFFKQYGPLIIIAIAVVIIIAVLYAIAPSIQTWFTNLVDTFGNSVNGALSSVDITNTP